MYKSKVKRVNFHVFSFESRYFWDKNFIPGNPHQTRMGVKSVDLLLPICYIFLAGCFSIKFLWCSSFIFMLLKMEQIYQMSKLIVIKWSKYWRKTPTRSSHYNNIATTHFSDALIIFLSRILLYSESERRPIISSVLSLSARASGSVVLQNLMLFMLL